MRQVCVPPSCSSCSFSSATAFFSPVSRFFFSFVPFAWPNRKRELARGTRLLSDREAIDRASARRLPPKGWPNVRTWRDRTSIFHRARLRITCPCAPHANRPFARPSLSSFFQWAVRPTIGKLYTVWRVDITEHIHSFSHWSEPNVCWNRGEEIFRLIYHSEHF